MRSRHKELGPLDPVYDTTFRRGGIDSTGTSGNDALEGELEQAIIDAGFDSYWTMYNSRTTEPDRIAAGPEGVVNGTYRTTITTEITGPDGRSYPRLGNAQIERMDSIPDSWADGVSTGFTWVLLFRPTDLGGASDGSVMVMGKDSGSNDQLEFRTESTDEVRASFFRSTNNYAKQRYTTSSPLSNNTWHLIEIYWPPGNTYPDIYFNGTLRNDATTNGGTNDGAWGDSQLEVGGDTGTPATTAYAQGYYAHVAVKLGALTAPQRAAIVTAAQTVGWIA